MSENIEQIYRLISEAQKLADDAHLTYVADLLDLAAVSIAQSAQSPPRKPKWTRRWRWSPQRRKQNRNMH